jgi:folylpolyglutamate synthase/dihydropteroate synthase
MTCTLSDFFFQAYPEATRVIQAEASRIGARLIQADDLASVVPSSNSASLSRPSAISTTAQACDIRLPWGESEPLKGVMLPLLGAHQRDNASTAVSVAACLREEGWLGMTSGAIRMGLERASPPLGRFQMLPFCPSYLDQTPGAQVVLDAGEQLFVMICFHPDCINVYVPRLFLFRKLVAQKRHIVPFLERFILDH